jgi:hypothetical protein
MSLLRCVQVRRVCKLALLAVCFAASAHAQEVPSPHLAESGSLSSTSYALRIKIVIGAVRDLPFDGTVLSVTVVDPAPLNAIVISPQLVRLTGLEFGETIVIVKTEKRRETLIVEVVGHPIPPPDAAVHADNKSPIFQTPSSGLYSVSFSPAQGGTRAFVSQKLQYRSGLSNGRILHFESDMFNFLGSRSSEFIPNSAAGFGVNRLSLGVSGRQGSLEVLDSELDLSPLSFNGYTIRGIHLTSTKSSIFRGGEFFAGLARPSVTLLDPGGGRVLGGMFPLKKSKTLSIRAGAVMVSPSAQPHAVSGGIVSIVNAEYMDGEDTLAAGEVAYGKSSFSWRGRMAIRRGPFNFSSEASHLDGQSPVISVGAQGGGRSTLAAAVGWQVLSNLSAFASYNQTKGAQTFNLSRLAFSGSTLTTGLSYRRDNRSQFGLRYTQQRINSDSLFALSSALETKAFIGTWGSKFAHNWSNKLEMRYNASQEPVAGAEMQRGFGLLNEVGHSMEWGSATAYFNHQNSAQSLSSLVLRNPTLLPPLIRQAFVADPHRFLATNRDLLQQILGDIELPQTRSTEVGVRLQAKLSRYSATGDVLYDDAKLGSQSQHNIIAALSFAMRVDSTNSIGLNTNFQRTLNSGASFGSQNGFSAITLSYTRQLNGPWEQGFLMKLLGRYYSTIKGRVFADLNADGKDDPQEPGIPSVKLQLEDGRTEETDQNGNFRFDRVKPGRVNVRLVADDLGTRLRASTAGQQEITLSSRETANVSFGVVDFGFIAGRVFNELQPGAADSSDQPGINGVRIKLIPLSRTMPPLTRVTDGSGSFEFRNLTPGKYAVQLDEETLPPYFRMPERTSWELSVQPVRGSYVDIPLFAQRRISGVVFVDKDGDGTLDPAVDEVVANATVVAGQIKAVSGPDGAYLLRGLPAGKIKIVATSAGGRNSAPLTIELDAGPSIKPAVNLVIPR